MRGESRTREPLPNQGDLIPSFSQGRERLGANSPEAGTQTAPIRLHPSDCTHHQTAPIRLYPSSDCTHHQTVPIIRLYPSSDCTHHQTAPSHCTITLHHHTAPSEQATPLLWPHIPTRSGDSQPLLTSQSGCRDPGGSACAESEKRRQAERCRTACLRSQAGRAGFLVLTLRLACSGILAELSEPQFLHLKSEHKDIYLTELLRGLHVKIM